MIRTGKEMVGLPGVDRPMRVLHCPTDVGGNPQGLARMERELGIQSMSVVFRPNKFLYESDQVLFDADDGLLQRQIKVWRLIWLAARNFDVIHYNFGRSLIFDWQGRDLYWPPREAIRTLVDLGYFRLLEMADVALLKRLGKGIVVTYQGDDARQGDYCLKHHEITFAREVDEGYFALVSDDRKRHQIERFSGYADRIYLLSPDLLDLVPNAEYLPCAHIDVSQWEPVYPQPRERPRVLHAPSHRGVKGTRYILDAMTRLEQEGVPFDFELVENLPHDVARLRYIEADLVVDQLLAGWYGGFAIEAMALGKPVVAYLRESDLHVLPPAMRAELPLIGATPGTVYEVLKEWLTARRLALPRRGRAGRVYVERWHDARAIARRVVADYAAIFRDRKRTG